MHWANRLASIAPNGRLENVTVVSVPRSRRGANSVTSDTRLGSTPPRPIPVTKRIAVIISSVGANAVSAVPIANNSVAAITGRRRPTRSAKPAHRERTDQHSGRSGRKDGPEPAGRHAPFPRQRRRRDSHRLDVETVDQRDGGARRDDAPLVPADRSRVDDLAYVDDCHGRRS